MIDLRPCCSEIKNQHDVKCASSCAVTELYEFRLNTILNKKSNMSTLFNYKTTRNILQTSGNIDCSTDLAMTSLILFGLIPDRYWPFVVSKYDVEPSAFCYALGQNFKAMEPIKLDYEGISNDFLLEKIKSILEKKLAVCFEFSASKECLDQTDKEGNISPPDASIENNQRLSVLAVGYDDRRKMKNLEYEGVHEGAFLFQNSLGKKWGDRGFGWLPYEYVLSGKVKGCWTITDSEFIDLEEFGLSYS
ncbi:MAG TPA: C1 family peptidase [Nitrososphaeraceae archaeon]|nr:C1 family peptidase [Nitrososphaeraceae archaeon]